MAKIQKIVHSEFRAMDKEHYFDVNAPEFNKYNIIFGYNGSGKSTLSNMLAILDKSFDLPTDAANYILTYENRDGNKDNQLPVDSTFAELNETRKYMDVKVFNRTFVEDKIFSVRKKLGFIIRIGDAGKEAEGFEEKKQVFKAVEKQAKEKEKNCINLTNEISKWLTSQARHYASNCTAIGVSIAPRFSKVQLEPLIKANKVSKHYSNDVIDKYREQLNVDKLESINYESKISVEEFNKIIKEANMLLSKSISIKGAIERLKENSSLNDWVRVGKENYIKHNACPFCEKEFDEGFVDALDAHYNQEAKELCNAVLEIKKEINDEYNKIISIKIEGKERFYKNLFNEYDRTIRVLEEERVILDELISLIVFMLDEKIKNVYNSKFKECPMLSDLTGINIYLDMVENNNGQTREIDKIKREAEECIKEFLIDPIRDEYVSLKSKLKKAEDIRDEENKKREILKKEIGIIESNLKPYLKTCDEINEYIKEYWGHTNFKLIPVDDGYIIKRDGEDGFASNLSEGEKTAIAFAYFITSLEDDDFDKKNGVVVIDDPITSLDSNSLFTVFALIRRKIADVGQLIIMTHSFLFLNEIKQWFGREKSKSNYYFADKKNGKLYLNKMPQTLINHNSDYNYLFERLYKVTKKEDIELDEKYAEANNLRRLLESFLAFKYSSKLDFYNKLFSHRTVKIDEVKKTRIFKYTNMFSHDTGSLGMSTNTDLTIVLQDVKSIIKDGLDLIKEIDPDHYRSMKDSIDTYSV